MVTRHISTKFGPTELYVFNQYGKYHIGFVFKEPVVLKRYPNGKVRAVLEDGSIFWPTAELRNRVFNEPSAATIMLLIQRMVKEQINENSKSNLR